MDWLFCIFSLAPPQLSSPIPCSAAESAQNFNAFLYSWICRTSFQVCQFDVEDFLLIWDFVQATSSVHTSLPSLIALVILLFVQTWQASNGQGPPLLLLQPLPLLSNLVSIDFHILQHKAHNNTLKLVWLPIFLSVSAFLVRPTNTWAALRCMISFNSFKRNISVWLITLRFQFCTMAWNAWIYSGHEFHSLPKYYKHLDSLVKGVVKQCHHMTHHIMYNSLPLSSLHGFGWLAFLCFSSWSFAFYHLSWVCSHILLWSFLQFSFLSSFSLYIPHSCLLSK